MSFDLLLDQPHVINTKQYEPAQFVAVNCKLGHFLASPLNFAWPCVPSNEITLSMIKTAIRQRHNGAAVDVRLFRDKLMRDELGAGGQDEHTLKELGYTGITGGSQSSLPSVDLFYDFTYANPTSESIDSTILLA
jgi:hypothetical protein